MNGIEGYGAYIDTSSRISTVNLYKKSLDNGDLNIINAIQSYGNDDEYLSFGLWSYVPDDSNTTPEIGFYANGGDPFIHANIIGLTGSTTYQHDAYGVYNDNDKIYNAIGDSSITANFDTEKVDGIINNWIFYDNSLPVTTDLGFNAVGTEIILHEADLNPDFTAWHGDTTMSNTTNGIIHTGKWSGQFYGNGANATTVPQFVAGIFDVENEYYAGGTFIGSFIGERQ